MAAYNEAAVIAEKIRNSLALDYPVDKLEIVIASDGSKDATAKLSGDSVKAKRQANPKAKPADGFAFSTTRRTAERWWF